LLCFMGGLLRGSIRARDLKEAKALLDTLAA
jgi:hypothetical protein